MNPNLIKTEKAIYKNFSHRVNYTVNIVLASVETLKSTLGLPLLFLVKLYMLLIVKVMMSLPKMQVDNV